MPIKKKKTKQTEKLSKTDPNKHKLQLYFKQFNSAWVHSLIVKKKFYFDIFILFKQF